MGESLIDAGIDGEVELVILSDSRSPDAWVQETMAFGRLREALAPALPVWYRRRWRNRARKAGNVEEFVERWGGRYDYMIVLDADSLMSAETLMALARAMDADPNLGILQTVPVIAGGHSFFARLQQFAGRAYGPVVARAIAAWQGEDGNYWGHNAIIRTAAFAAACGLPVLPGRKPFGGEIMSHDFVEAALMRRAGWSVRMAPDLGGSWEESPPSLLDVAIRDRRWAQGNLQHTKVITAAGLAWPNRVHFAIGIMSYLSSLFWLGLIIVGISLTLQAELGRPEYFPNTFQLFPDWPRFDAVRMFWLFVFTMVVLFLPKVIGLIGVLWQRGLRQGCGGALAAIVSVLLETLLSALYAPIMMLLQSRQIYEILRGRDSGWATQRRAGGTSWGDAWRYHRWHMVTGVVLAVGAWLISPVALAWLSPIVIGLILAIPLSRLSGSGTAGRIVSWLRLLRIPEDVEPPMVERRRDELVLRSPPLPEDGLLAVVQSKTLREQHIAALLPRPEEMRGVPDADRLTAAAKVADAETRDEALSWLNPGERVQVLADPTLLQTVADLPHLTSHSA
jgi:membrane glycosyltransferase